MKRYTGPLRLSHFLWMAAYFSVGLVLVGIPWLLGVLWICGAL